MITLARVGCITGTALPNNYASLSQVQQPPSLLAGEHITSSIFIDAVSRLSCVKPTTGTGT